ncbi:MAG: cupin domain-containing protein [Actinobacteria bacterium]|nr:cupin domain-containing protein [Actinomycetota bacterium]
MPHDELGEGEQQEELYVVIDGRARFICDGDPVELGPGDVLHARPGVRREAVALESPTMLLIVRGTSRRGVLAADLGARLAQAGGLAPREWWSGSFCLRRRPPPGRSRPDHVHPARVWDRLGWVSSTRCSDCGL